MRIIVDANRILAALIRNGTSREILSNTNIQFIVPEFVIEEVLKYSDYIVKKSKMDNTKIELLLTLLLHNTEIVLETEIKEKMKDAMEIMKNIDINDSPILACALSTANDGIWSEDKHFEKQETVRIWKTIDIIDYLSETSHK